MVPPSPEKPPRTLLDYQLSFKRLDTLSTIVCDLIKWSALVGIAYMMYVSVARLAGQVTFADIGINVIGNLKVSGGVISVLGGSGWAYGLAQRSLRRRHIERTAPLKNKLERIIDSKRTSSDLTSRGTTPPKKGK